MKKVFLTLTFILAFVLGTIATPTENLNAIEDEVVTIYPDDNGRYNFSGEIVWDGDYGYTSFIYVGLPGDDLQIRQEEKNYVSLHTNGNTVTITINKSGWMDYGSPSYVSFYPFKGYSTWGSISLIVPPAN